MVAGCGILLSGQRRGGEEKLTFGLPDDVSDLGRAWASLGVHGRAPHTYSKMSGWCRKKRILSHQLERFTLPAPHHHLAGGRSLRSSIFNTDEVWYELNGRPTKAFDTT